MSALRVRCDRHKQKTTVTKEWLKTKTYLLCDNRAFKSKLAENFYKQYMVEMEAGNYKSAFYALLHSAWACDDARDEDNAIYCRKKALEIIDKVVVAKDAEETLLLMKADILRRAGQFEQVICEYEGKIFSQELLSKIAAFQVEKAKQKDVACYTVADVE